MKLKLINILSECKKIDSTNALFESIEAVVELCREDIRRIAASKALNFTDFDWAFKESAAMTMTTFKKSHLKTVQRVVTCNRIDEITRILIQRILANMRNITTDERYSQFVAVQIERGWKDYNIEQNQIDYATELEDIDRNRIKEGLRTVWYDALEDQDFDEIDFRELCEKFGFTVYEVMGNTPFMKAEQTAGGHRQLVLFFDPND